MKTKVFVMDSPWVLVVETTEAQAHRLRHCQLSSTTRYLTRMKYSVLESDCVRANPERIPATEHLVATCRLMAGIMYMLLMRIQFSLNEKGKGLS